jgi:hypothetical protein
MILENTVYSIFARHPLPTTAEAQVHFLSGVLMHSFQLANKSLPQGHRTNPTFRCPHQLEKLLNERNAAWHQAVINNTAQDWEYFMTKAASFCSEMRRVQTEYWRSYCNDLSYSTDAAQVTKTLNSLIDTTFPETSTNILRHPITNVKLYTPVQQANAHRIHCASVSKKTVSRSQREDYNERLTRVATYLKQKDMSPNALPFMVKEINHALQNLPHNKAPGEDGIYNEVLAHIHNPVGHILL